MKTNLIQKKLRYQFLITLNSIAQNQSKIKVKGISGSSISVLIHKLFKKLDRPIFYLTNDSEKSSYIYTDLDDTIEKDLIIFRRDLEKIQIR